MNLHPCRRQQPPEARPLLHPAAGASPVVVDRDDVPEAQLPASVRQGMLASLPSRNFSLKGRSAVVSPFALSDMDDHPVAVNVGDLLSAQSGAADPSGVQSKRPPAPCRPGARGG